MAAAEAAQTSLGPSFAPEDPSLPKPWKGLIDGSTGVLYYWNPETNVTQYEKPAGSAPPMPPGPPLASALKLAPVLTSNSSPSNGPLSHQQTEQQTFQQPFEHVQQLQQNQLQPSVQQMPAQQMPLQQLHQQPYQQLQSVQSQPPVQIVQQPSQQYSHLQQLPFHHVPYVQGQLISRPQGQFQYQPGPQAFQFPYQQSQQPKSLQPLVGQELQESQAAHQLGQQLQGSQHSEQQVQRLQAPNATHEPGQKSQSPTAVQQYGMQPHVQNFLKQQDMLQQCPQPSQQQLPQIGFATVGDSGHQEGRLAGSSSLLQQAANHLLPGLTSQAHTPQSGVNIIQPQQQSPIKPSSGMDQAHQAALESSHHQVQTGSHLFPNQMSHSMVRPSVVPKAGYADDQHERRGAEFYSSGRSEGPMMIPVQPKLAPIPLSRNQQDMRASVSGLPPSFPPKFTDSGHPGGLPSHGPPNMYGNAAFPRATSVRPHPRMFGAPDSPNISADAYRRHHEVTAMGDNIPAPFMTFEATGFPPEIMREIHAAGFLSPTPIQAQTWPVALQNRDVVAIAKTGSGKTLGYLIPAFIHLRRCQNNPQYGPTVLILAPTRELATQIQDEAIKFGRSSRISCTCLYGGAPKGPQLKDIDRGVDIVVATPGRLNDILEMGRINFRQVSFLVLDEADRMLDMGFELQIRKIVNVIPPRRQTLMYTATWPMEVRKIAGDLLVNPVQVNIGRVDELVANKSITQYVEVVSQTDKQRRLEQILRSQERGTKTIIFCSTKKLCDQLARSIGRPFGAIAIHGDKSQTERDHVLNQFRTGRIPILVATDVAARGLDIKDIRVVVNYDFPTGTEDYVHRIGRTGRAGATGVSYTFFTEQDWKHAPELIKVLEGANQRVPQEIREMAARAGPPSQRPLPHGGMSRWDSGGGNSDGRLDFSGGRGTREFGRGGRGFGGRGGRSDFVDGRGGGGYRGRGFGRAGWGRHDRGGGLRDRFQNSDGRGRYDDRRGFGDRFRGRSHSRSPEKGRSRGYDRSRSGSGSRSWSRSRSRSWSRGRSPSRSRSRSRSYGRYDQPRSRSRSPRRRRVSGFDVPLVPVAGVGHHESEVGRLSGFDAAPPFNPGREDPAESDHPAPRVSGFDAPPAARMSPMSPGNGDVAFPGGAVGD